MKKTSLLLAFLLLLISGATAQTLFDALQGTKTNFQIVSDGNDLKVTDQIIIRNAEKVEIRVNIDEYGYGYAYQSFHLEFISRKSIVAIKSDDFADKNLLQLAFYLSGHKFLLSFYDWNNNLLTATTIPDNYVDVFTNASADKRMYFYSIDLIDIPILILENAKRIDIVELLK